MNGDNNLKAALEFADMIKDMPEETVKEILAGVRIAKIFIKDMEKSA